MSAPPPSSPRLDLDDPIARLEEAAAMRFVRWDRDLWRDVLDGPGRRLSKGLLAKGDPDAKPLVEAWLRLAAEAIGLGYLVPADRLGAENVLTRLWTRTIPDQLADVPRDRRTAALATAWNLGENLEHEPSWLQRVFLRFADDLRLDRLDDFVTSVGTRVLGPPGTTLDPQRARVSWVPLSFTDRRFLPGDVRFVAPTVLCVTDRLRPQVTLGVWLDREPVVLGPMTAPEDAPPADGDDDLWRRQRSPLVTRRYASARNAWRAACSLVTSQHLLVAMPAT